MPLTPKIVFMGTPAFATGVLSYLLEHNYPVCGVVTVPDKPAGRGLGLRQSDVKTFALAHNLPVLQPERLKDPAFLEALASWEANLFVVVAFRMLPEVVWQMPALGCFNLHASLLPQYRGAAPINHALINGETQTGVTTFLLDQQIDTGAVLLQETVPVLPHDNVATLHDRLMQTGGPLVARTVDGLVQGTLTPLPQVVPAMLKSAPKIFKDTCTLQWAQTPRELVNRIRGLSPYPGAVGTVFSAKGALELKIFEAQAEDAAHALPYGTLVTDYKKYLKVACAGGFVTLLQLQAPAKKRMPVAAFLAGFRD